MIRPGLAVQQTLSLTLSLHKISPQRVYKPGHISSEILSELKVVLLSSFGK